MLALLLFCTHAFAAVSPMSYLGTTTFHSDVTKPVNIVLSRLNNGMSAPGPGQPEDVQLKMIFDPSAKLVVYGSLWNSTHFSGVTSQSNGTQMFVGCDLDPTTVKCAINFADNGIVATAQGLIAGPEDLIPVNPSLATSAITYTYSGVSSAVGTTPAQNVKLVVTQREQSSAQVLGDLLALGIPPLNATFSYGATQPVPFPYLNYNQANATLDGNVKMYTSSGQPWNYTLHCTGFTFARTATGFACLYSSNNSSPIQFSF